MSIPSDTYWPSSYTYPHYTTHPPYPYYPVTTPYQYEGSSPYQGRDGYSYQHNLEINECNQNCLHKNNPQYQQTGYQTDQQNHPSHHLSHHLDHRPSHLHDYHGNQAKVTALSEEISAIKNDDRREPLTELEELGRLVHLYSTHVINYVNKFPYRHILRPESGPVGDPLRHVPGHQPLPGLLHVPLKPLQVWQVSLLWDTLSGGCHTFGEFGVI